MNLPLCSKAAAMLFQALSLAILSLYAFLLGSYITGKLHTQSINFSSNSCLQLIVYKKYKCREQTPTLATCCDNTSAPFRRSYSSDAVVAQCSGTCAASQRDTHEYTRWSMLMSVALKTHSPWKLQLWLQCAASRVCKRHRMVVKNHTLRDSNYTNTKH